MSSRAVSNGMLPRIISQSGKPYLRVMERFCNALYIISSLYLGIALLMLPWISAWDSNYLLYVYPQIRPIVANSFFKGAVLGLGIVNILIGIQEIVRFRKAAKGGPPQ
jgi:hypothetical protein